MAQIESPAHQLEYLIAADNLIDRIIEAARKQEMSMSTIADLATAVSNLAAAAAAIPPPVTGTVIDPADQATLDSAVTELDTVVTQLQALATPPAVG